MADIGVTTNEATDGPRARKPLGVVLAVISLLMMASAVLVAALPATAPGGADCGYAALPSEGHGYDISDGCRSPLSTNRTISTVLVAAGATGLTIASIRARRWYSVIGIALSAVMVVSAWTFLYRFR